MQAKLDTVKKHMTGKRFNAAKGTSCAKQHKAASTVQQLTPVFCHVAEFENDERELMEEPDIETSEEVNAFAPVSCPQCMPASFAAEGDANDLEVHTFKKQCLLNSCSPLPPPLLHVIKVSC